MARLAILIELEFIGERIMRVTATFRYPGAHLVNEILRRHGIHVRPLDKHGLLYYLEVPAHGSRSNVQVVPPELLACPEFSLRLKCAEPPCTHHLTRYGATVICDDHGRPFRPRYIPKQHEQAKLGLARFLVPPPVVTIWCRPTLPTTVAISRHTIFNSHDGGLASVNEELVWAGLPINLPTNIRHFEEAMAAALHKAACTRICTLPTPHFVAYPKM